MVELPDSESTPITEGAAEIRRDLFVPLKKKRKRQGGPIDVFKDAIKTFNTALEKDDAKT